MPNYLIRVRPVSASNVITESGMGGAQKFICPNAHLITGTGSGLACDRSENFYISDRTRHVIYRWKRGQTSSIVFAGQLDVSGNSDGQGTAASFNKPGPMCVDRSGFIWILDVGNQLIRRMTDNAKVTTVAAISIGANEVPGQIIVDDSGNLFYIDTLP